MKATISIIYFLIHLLIGGTCNFANLQSSNDHELSNKKISKSHQIKNARNDSNLIVLENIDLEEEYQSSENDSKVLFADCITTNNFNFFQLKLKNNYLEKLKFAPVNFNSSCPIYLYFLVLII
ncbi:MAG: hypothetical protein H7174_11530 [Flavobacterium sp.]|nr:hypothetical protein [Flavobacterium sp.]